MMNREDTMENQDSSPSRKDFLVKAGAVAAGAVGATSLDVGHSIAAPAHVQRTDASQITLQFWELGGETPAQVKYWQNLCAQYTALHPNVKVQVTFVPNYTGTNKLASSFSAGVGPDVFVISPGDLLRYVTNGIAQPLNSYLTAAEMNDFLPSVLKAMEVNGKIYYLKYEMEPMALWYDKKLFAEKGLQPPKTWEQMIDTALKLTTPRRAGIAIELTPDVYQNFTWYPFIWQGGGDVVDPAWTHAEIDGPAGVAALQLWGDLINKYKVTPKRFIVRTFDITLLAKGFTAMQVCGIWAGAALQQGFPKFDAGVTALPYPSTGHPQTVFGGWGFVASSQSKNPQEAARFAAWLGAGTDAAAAKRGADWVGVVKTDLSPRKSVTALQTQRGFFKQHPYDVFLKEVYPNALAEPRFTQEIIQAVSTAIQAVQFGGASGKSAATAAAKTINAYLKSYKGAR